MKKATTTGTEFTKATLKALSWPKGATHARLTTPEGKTAVSAKKSVVASFDGVSGTIEFGAMIKNGKKQEFVPIAGARVGEVPQPAAVETAPTAAAPKADKPAGKREPGLVAFLKGHYELGQLNAWEVAKEVAERFGGTPEQRMIRVRAIPQFFKTTGVVGGWRKMTKEEKRATRGTSSTGKRARLDAAEAVVKAWRERTGQMTHELGEALTALSATFTE
jgi:hypothetical protein